MSYTIPYYSVADHTGYLGMGPKLTAYVDKKGRPIVVVIIQLLFRLLAYINLALSGGDVFT